MVLSRAFPLRFASQIEVVIFPGTAPNKMLKRLSIQMHMPGGSSEEILALQPSNLSTNKLDLMGQSHHPFSS
eukprot:4415330-Ditylum_brightwellii.AAC.1